MPDIHRVFLLGAGFSCGSGMPDATTLTSILFNEALPQEKHREAREYLDQLSALIEWIDSNHNRLNIEDFFEYATLDAERWRYRQHRDSGRRTGNSFWASAETIERRLDRLVDYLGQCIWKEQDKCSEKTGYIEELIAHFNTHDDTIISFNYDTLLEQSLSNLEIEWNYGLPDDDRGGLTILKMHGSINWALYKRNTELTSEARVLYVKRDTEEEQGRGEPTRKETEYHYKLIEILDQNEIRRTAAMRKMTDRLPALAGLGSRKPIHRIPGLGWVWERAAQSIFDTNEIIAIGFTFSTFDNLARLALGDAMMQRDQRGLPLSKLTILDMNADALIETYHQIFHLDPTPINERVECVDWNKLL